jgi:Tfp pilus assembly protein PilF
MMRFFIFSLAAFCLSACTSWSTTDTEKADLHLRVGTSLLENGNFPQALSELLAAEELDSGNPAIQNNLGLVYFARGKNEIAVVHLRKALELKANYTDAKINLGRVLIEEEKFLEADRWLNDSAQDLTYTSPQKPLLNLGLSAFRQRKFKDARRDLVKSLEYKRDDCLAQTLYGRSLYELKEFPSAAQTLDQAIGFCVHEQADEAQYYSALSYYQTGEQRKAETRLEEIIKLYPEGRYRDRARSLLETMRR